MFYSGIRRYVAPANQPTINYYIFIPLFLQGAQGYHLDSPFLILILAAILCDRPEENETISAVLVFLIL